MAKQRETVHNNEKPSQTRGGAGCILVCALLLVLCIALACALINRIFFTKGSIDQDAVTEELTEEEISGLSELSDEARRLYGIRASLDEGNSVLSTLRKYFPEDIITFKKNKYYFIPIDDELAKHTYRSECVTVLGSGEYVYEDEGVATHRGIDVSSHQGAIDWEQVAKDDIEFAVLRALYRGYGSGKLVEDTEFRANLSGARAQGLGVGIYIFTQALDETEVEEEIALLKELLGDFVPELPVVVDVEEAGEGEGRMDQLSVSERTDLIKYYCERLKEEGYTPMIYYNLDGALLMLDLSELEDIDKWFAVYDTLFYFPYRYTLWQYSETGRVDGIHEYVDLDIYFGDW